MFYNQAFNTFFNFVGRGWAQLEEQIKPIHCNVRTNGSKQSSLKHANAVSDACELWITDPPYADAVNYEELSEFFLAWYKPHLQVCFSDWYADSKRDHAVKGRVSRCDWLNRKSRRIGLSQRGKARNHHGNS